MQDTCYLACKMQVKEAIKGYLEYADNILGLDETTLSTKTRHLGWFCDYVNKETQDITLNDITEFVAQLQKSDIRKWRVKIDIRAFFRYLNENHLSDLSYTLIRNKEPEFSIRPAVTDEEFRLMDAYLHTVKDNNKTYLKWHTIFHFLYETGLRRTEVCNIREWDNEHRTFYVLTAKTHKKRQGFYLTDLSPYLEKFKPQKVLFHTSKREIGEIIGRVRDRSGVKRHITPHSFRHAYCTRLLTSGCPIQQTALLAGHQKISTTMRYYHEVNLRDAYETYIKPPKTYEFKSKVGVKNKFSVKLQITKNS